jgi:hypothetical protein
MPGKRPVRGVRVAVAVIALVALFSGCSGIGSQVNAPEGGYAEPAAGMPEGQPQDSAQRYIARSASLDVVVEDIGQATDAVEKIADDASGLVTSESIDLPADGASSGAGSASIVISVPSDSLEAVMDQLAGLGLVQSRVIEASDVTDRVVDTDSRVRTLQESVNRLQELIARAGSVSEIASVEAELTNRQAELEAMLAQQASLKTQVEKASVRVSIWTRSQNRPADTNYGFLDGLESGWSSLVRLGSFALVVLGALLPYLGLAAIIGIPIVLLRRRWRKTHPKPAPRSWPSAPTAAAQPYPPTPVPRPTPVSATKAAPATQTPTPTSETSATQTPAPPKSPQTP